MATGLENLKIYQMAKNLEIQVHKFTTNFPKEERFRSVDQLRRSSSSVPNNIAEAYYKQSIKEKIHILKDIAMCEAEESRSNLLRCGEKGLASTDIIRGFNKDYTSLKKAIHGYIRFLRNQNKKE
jgi:four helix bundle protein